MRRIETYVGQQVYEWAFSAQAQQNMTALAKVCGALFGTAATVNGLACTPTSPASMTVQLGAGEIYQLESLEATVCGTLPADTTHTILKQGIQLDAVTTATFAAPSTSGQSIAYLIQAQYQDSDISLDPTTGLTNVVLQFYNASAPATPWSGPNDSGSTSNTFRDGVVSYSIKAGVAATTGSQATPTPDSGYVGLWVVTVPYGATTLTTANIAAYASSPALSASLLAQIQARALLGGSAAQQFLVAAATATGQAVNLGQFPATVGATGSIGIPNTTRSVVIKQGLASVPTTGAVTVTFPTAFPTAVRAILPGISDAGSTNYKVASTNQAPNGFTLTSTNTANATAVYWLAIGD